MRRVKPLELTPCAFLFCENPPNPTSKASTPDVGIASLNPEFQGYNSSTAYYSFAMSYQDDDDNGRSAFAPNSKLITVSFQQQL
jgi:hypothetical protein